jgi:hypothetical protein
MQLIVSLEKLIERSETTTNTLICACMSARIGPLPSRATFSVRGEAGQPANGKRKTPARAGRKKNGSSGRERHRHPGYNRADRYQNCAANWKWGVTRGKRQVRQGVSCQCVKTGPSCHCTSARPSRPRLPASRKRLARQSASACTRCCCALASAVCA